jgi:TolB-like protein
MAKKGSLFTELRRRKVYQTGAAYVAASLAVWGAVEIATGALAGPGMVLRVVILLSLVGLPIAIAAAWTLELKREEGSGLGRGSVPLRIAIGAGGLAGIIAFLGLGITVAGVPESSSGDTDSAGAPLLTPIEDEFRLAVLPFEDRTPRRSLGDIAEAFTYGLVDELRSAGVNVVDAAATDRLGRSGVTPRDIAAELGVSGLVRGSLDFDGQEVTVDLDLLDGGSGESLVTAREVATVEEVLQLRQRVVLRAADLVRQGIGQAVRLTEQRRAAPTVEAWIAVAEADRYFREHLRALEEGDAEAVVAALDVAEAKYEAAQRLAPDWSAPVTGKAWASYRRYIVASSELELREFMLTASDFATAAIGLNPFDREAYEARGTASYRRWLMGSESDGEVLDSLLESARDDLELVVGLDSLDATANSTLSHLYYQVDEWARVIEAAERSYRNDPYLESAVRDDVLWRLFTAAYDLGDAEAAIDYCDEGSSSFPANHRFSQCQLLVMTLPTVNPDIERAWALREGLMPKLPDDSGSVSPTIAAQATMIVGGVIARAGHADSADVVMREEGALERLRLYTTTNEEHAPAGHWWWENVEEDPRFEELSGNR